MEKLNKLPPFNLLGYNIQTIVFKRIGEEKLEKINLNIESKEFDKKSKVYSLLLCLKFDLSNSKENEIKIIGGFKINEEKILEKENNIVSIFAASLFPYIRSTIHNLSSDDREPLNLPVIDLRFLDLSHGVSLERE